ncbi:kinase-like domain-containing protein [Glomus cerebriforme]|uniref:Kinase-like domain-containing protein n=2 Tax=Glomus cerebriforme TaxID=658196 RepID=A0A397S2L7_9GLOM|nr:kinase-like domain-containing protein [Glomus cerebriforme]
MNNVAICYKNGFGTEKNLEKVFYWYQKARENNKIISLSNNELCKECENPYIDYYWCQQCNIKHFQQDFLKWTSKNEFIDKFIQEAQLNARNSYEILEWIPYDKLKNISYHDKGGFSKIYKAIWLDGPINNWNFDKQQWNRWNFQTGYEVILKVLNNSSGLNNKFLDEWKHHYNCQKKSFSKFIQIFGITQDPNNLDYIIVMSYAKEGSLRKCLSNLVKFEWQYKLLLLKNIILGLKVIHESDLIHRDLHDGNILISDNYETYIIDLGLCKPINDLQDEINNNYGVLPYIAPEVLRNKPYTLASDIYSFSMIMWEFTSGVPPFNNVAHDYDLVLNICDGERPEIIKNTPKCYIELMKKCWDTDPFKRPTIIELRDIISQWLICVNEYYKDNDSKNSEDKFVRINSDIDYQFRNNAYEFVEANKDLAQEQVDTYIAQLHPQACYTSRILTEILDQKDFGSLESCMIKD